MEARSFLCGLVPKKEPSAKSKSKPEKEKLAKRKHLPVGNGEYTVACVDIMTDYCVSGTFIRLFYPTNSTNIYQREDQWPLWLPTKQYGKGFVYFRRKNTKVYGKIMNWVGGDVHVPALWQGPFVSGNQKFPLLLWSHGLGGNRTVCSALCTQIASHGYVIACIEHRDGSASMTYCYKDPVSNNNCSAERDRTSDNLSSASANSSEKTTTIESCESKTITTNNIQTSPSDSERKDTKKMTTSPSGISLASMDIECEGCEVEELVMREGAKEHWLWYERQENEEDYEIRNLQVKKRRAELVKLLDILEKLNNGEDVKNVLTPDFNMEQFAGKLDMTRVAMLGHSFGASSAIAAMNIDPRFRCGIAMDAWMMPLDEDMYVNTPQPLLLLNSELFGWYENMIDMAKFNANCDKNQRIMITLKDTCHQSFSDFQFMVPKKVGQYLWLRAEQKPILSLNLITQATLGFLAKHLDIPGQPLHEDILSAEHELVMLGTNVDLTKPPPAK